MIDLSLQLSCGLFPKTYATAQHFHLKTEKQNNETYIYATEVCRMSYRIRAHKKLEKIPQFWVSKASPGTIKRREKSSQAAHG